MVWGGEEFCEPEAKMHSSQKGVTGSAMMVWRMSEHQRAETLQDSEEGDAEGTVPQEV